MTISAQIVADSISPTGKRITTFQLRYPRFIHAELMTHRVFSRNASSSRAIPTKKYIEEIKNDPAMPIYWGANKPGMQAGEELTGDDLNDARAEWLAARDKAIAHVEHLMELGLHKQIANRILEPWTHINVVVTSTEWANFYALRCHKDAQPEIRMLAEAMRKQQAKNKPMRLKPGEWHLPYVHTVWTNGEFDGYRHIISDDKWIRVELSLAQKLSVARCARVSYKAFDGSYTTIDKDLELYEKLVGSRPMHASPAEHQATPDIAIYEDEKMGILYERPDLHGNFVGWRQYRKMLPDECVKEL